MIAKGLPSQEVSPSEQSELWFGEDKLILHLKTRKNMPRGCRLRRGCECDKCKRTCPVHVLIPRLRQVFGSL